MTVKEIIENSQVIVGRDEEAIDFENCVPCNGVGDFDFFGNQPCFVFADQFIERYGSYEAVKLQPNEAPEDQEMPEEIYGKQSDFDWYKVVCNNLVFGVW